MKTAITILLALLMVSCNHRELDNRIENCPNANINGEHDYRITSVDDGKGWMSEKCKNCGLERKSNPNMESPKHHGFIAIYLTPSTGKYDDWRIEYIDMASGSNKEHTIKITESDTQPKQNNY